MDVNGLSEEVKAKLRGCRSAEELRSLAEEGIELTDELLEAVSGGGLWPSCMIDEFDSAKNFDLGHFFLIRGRIEFPRLASLRSLRMT